MSVAAAPTRQHRERRAPWLSHWLSIREAGAMRVVIVVFLVLLVLLQYRLWFGDGGVNEMLRLKQEIATQQDENAVLRERNESLEAEVVDLKDGEAAIEERARRELGMIRRSETFYQAIDE